MALVYIHLVTADLNVARVVQRVAEGGHAVPQDKVIARRARVMALMVEAIAAANESVVLDNSDDGNPFAVVARVTGGTVVHQVEGLTPELARLLPNAKPRRGSLRRAEQPESADRSPPSR